MSAPRASAPRGFAWLLVVAAVAIVVVLLVLPVVSVFVTAFSAGVGPYVDAISSTAALDAIRLTLVALAIAVPLNTAFGLSAAWAITRFTVRGRGLLLALIDLPLAVSPIVAGLVFVFLFGARGLVGGWLLEHGVQVIYATPAIVLATTFVTLPFVARELIPLMQSLGRDEEVAAATLGASAWHIFWRVTLPNIRWGLFYGVIVCAARALGEFGAVSVVSGHIQGETNTVPLHVEVLYNDYDQVGAFAVASLLTLVGLVGLIAKKAVESRLP